MPIHALALNATDSKIDRPVGSNFKPVRPWVWSVGVASWCGSHSLFYAFNAFIFNKELQPGLWKKFI